MLSEENGSKDKSSVHLVLSKGMILLMGLFLLIPWIIVCIGHKMPVSISGAKKSGDNDKIITGSPGPWGDLEYVKIFTEMPDEFAFTVSSDTVPQRWFFKGYSQEQTMALIRASGLTAQQVSILEDKKRWEINAQGCWVDPGEEVVLGMVQKARQKIYLTLSRFTENKPQRVAYSFRPAFLQDRIDGSGLSENSVAWFKKMLYQQGAFLLFCDLAYVLPKLSNDEERKRFIKMISRRSTLMVKLKISEDSDIDKLVSYWGGGGRAKDLKPLLESLGQFKKGYYIDIVHLLPPFARQRLYTYPVVSANAAYSLWDCNWTTMNFFNTEPDDQFANIEYLSKKFEKDYYQISAPGRLGDLIFLALPSGESIHSAVYIADNIVFTKNGQAISQPWMLMRLEDMLELYAAPYPPEEAIKVLSYRKKDM